MEKSSRLRLRKNYFFENNENDDENNTACLKFD